MTVKKGQKDSSLNFLTGIGEMETLIRNVDWGKTRLGDIENWPQSLKTIAGTCLHLKSPALLFWGKDLNIIFNDAFRKITPQNNTTLGRPGKEVWGYAGKLLDEVINEGKSTKFENQLQVIERDGGMQDAYFSYSHSPVYDETGKIAGIFTLVSETTDILAALEKEKKIAQVNLVERSRLN